MQTDPRLAAVSGKLSALASELMLQASLLADSRRRLAGVEASLALQAAGVRPALPVEFRSQFGEDALLWSIFDGRRTGFFIEAGAFNGLDLSVSYALESVGWTGLLIEPIPHRADQCAVNRPHSKVVHAALGKKGSTGTASFTLVDDSFGGMLSYHTTDARHLDFLASRGESKSTINVPLTSLDAVLEDHAPPGLNIDVAIIDVEGGEPDLFDGFNLDRWKPAVMIVEDNSRGTSPTGAALGNMIMAKNYAFLGWCFVNGVWIRKDQPDLLKRASRLMRP